LVSFGVFDLLILGQMGIFEVGIFRRLVAWVFSPDLDDIHRPFLRIPYTVYNIRKKKKMKKKRTDLFFSCIFFLKTNPDFGDVGKE